MNRLRRSEARFRYLDCLTLQSLILLKKVELLSSEKFMFNLLATKSSLQISYINTEWRVWKDTTSMPMANECLGIDLLHYITLD